MNGQDIIIRRIYEPKGKRYLVTVYCDEIKLADIMKKEHCSERAALDMALLDQFPDNVSMFDLPQITRKFRTPEWLNELLRLLAKANVSMLRYRMKILVDENTTLDERQLEHSLEDRFVELGGMAPIVIITPSTWGREVEETRIPGETFHKLLVAKAREAGIEIPEQDRTKN